MLLLQSQINEPALSMYMWLLKENYILVFYTVIEKLLRMSEWLAYVNLPFQPHIFMKSKHRTSNGNLISELSCAINVKYTQQILKTRKKKKNMSH